MKMPATISKSFVLIFTIGLLIMLGILGNLKDGYADAGGTRETATLLTLGTPYPETIDPGNDVDYFRIVITQSGKLTVWTTGDLDTEGELQDSSGTSIAENDDGGPDFNFKIIYSVAPGTYYLKVIELLEDTGNYTVRSTFVTGQVSDVGDTRETATLLTLGTSYTEDIHLEEDVDYFRIVITQSGKLTVWTTGNLDTNGELQDSSGANIAENDDGGPGDNFRIVCHVKAGTYYLKVTEVSYEVVGAYVLQTAFEQGQDDVGDTRETATLLALGTPYTEAMHLSAVADVDYFRIVAGESGNLIVWTTGDLDTNGELQDSSGTSVTQNNDNEDDSNFKIIYYVAPGTYYLKVTEIEEDSGSYTVQATLEPGQEAGNTRATATLLTLRTPYPENIHLGQDVDYFRIVITQSGKLTVWTTGDLDTNGELQDSSGTSITQNNDGALNKNFRIVHNVETGTYYLKVTAIGEETGSYTVHTGLEPAGQFSLDVGDTRETATLLALGRRYTEDIHLDEDVDYFRIIVTQSGNLTVWTTGNLDTNGELQDSSGANIAENDDGALNKNFRIVYYVETGTYYLKVTAIGEETGRYAVQATLEPGQDVGDTREAATPLALDTPILAYIAPIDDVDYFRIVVDQPGELTAWTTGDLDTEGELQTDDGTVLGSDDDGGSDNLNFRIVYNAQPGTYYLKVIGQWGETGSYAVHARLEPEQSLTITTITDETDETDDGGPTQPDLSTHKVVLSEFMFESEGGENSLPQWIEVYNNSSSEINFRGWKLGWKRLQPSLLEVTTTFKQDFIIPAQQSRVIVTALGRHSMGGGGNLSNDVVYQLHVLHAEELAQDDIANRNRLITRGGFSLKLINSNDVIVDQIGTLNPRIRGHGNSRYA